MSGVITRKKFPKVGDSALGKPAAMSPTLNSARTSRIHTGKDICIYRQTGLGKEKKGFLAEQKHQVELGLCLICCITF